MRVAVGADATGALTDTIVAELRKRGVEVTLYGALDDGSSAWAAIGRAVGQAVVAGHGRRRPALERRERAGIEHARDHARGRFRDSGRVSTHAAHHRRSGARRDRHAPLA